MPDDKDYEDLEGLLRDPTAWTKQDAETSRFVLKTQHAAAAEVDRRDRARRARVDALALAASPIVGQFVWGMVAPRRSSP
jgi:hypothetical protein